MNTKDYYNKYLQDNFFRSFYKYKRIEVRDIDAGEEPFTYTTGNRGPGYVDVKGGVGIDEFFETAIRLLTNKIIHESIPVDVIVGMMTGGAIPGYLLKQELSRLLNQQIVYIYQRSERHATGHGELDTGCNNNPFIYSGQQYLIVEELINFGKTTVKGVLYERSKGVLCNNAACILFYDNADAKVRLKENKINVTYATTLPEVLTYGKKNGYLSERAHRNYLDFLDDPAEWHVQRGFEYFG